MSDRTQELVEELELEEGRGWQSMRCPAHEDSSPSLSAILNDDGSVGMRCHAGCEVEDIIDALGYEVGTVRVKGLDKWPGGVGGPRLVSKPTKKQTSFPEPCDPPPSGLAHPRFGPPTYVFDLRSRDNKFYAAVCRWGDGSSKIVLPWRGGQWKLGTDRSSLPLYGVHLLPAVKPEFVFITEGERAAKELLDRGMTAVGTGGATQKHDPHVWEELAGHDVVLWQDSDDAGEGWTRLHLPALRGVAKSVRVFVWGQDGADAVDYFAAGHDVFDLVPEIRKLPIEVIRKWKLPTGKREGSARGIWANRKSELVAAATVGDWVSILGICGDKLDDQTAFELAASAAFEAGIEPPADEDWDEALAERDAWSAAPEDPVQSFRDETGLDIKSITRYRRSAADVNFVAEIADETVELGDWVQLCNIELVYRRLRNIGMEWPEKHSLDARRFSVLADALSSTAATVMVDDVSIEVERVITEELMAEVAPMAVALNSNAGCFRDNGRFWFRLATLRSKVQRSVGSMALGKGLIRTLTELDCVEQEFQTTKGSRTFWGYPG